MPVMEATHVSLVSATVTESKTLAVADNGVAQVVTADATLTLPATAAGFNFTIVCGSQRGNVTINLSPVAADLIAGNGAAGVDNKDVISTLGNYGDTISVRGDGANGWVITEVRGTWTREA